METKFVDSLAATVNSGASLEVLDVTILPHSPDGDLLLKLCISVIIGVFSPIVNDQLRLLRAELARRKVARQTRRSLNMHYRKRRD